MEICAPLKRQVKILGKIGLAALVSYPHPLHAQTERGTVIVVYFSKDKIVVAADSLTLIKGGGTGKQEYSWKVGTPGKKMLFAAAGRTWYLNGAFHPLP